jgi:hypothetical protein
MIYNDSSSSYSSCSSDNISSLSSSSFYDEEDDVHLDDQFTLLLGKNKVRTPPNIWIGNFIKEATPLIKQHNKNISLEKMTLVSITVFFYKMGHFYKRDLEQ